MYQALYRKYRPTSFSEVVGQKHITETLKNQLAAGRVFHAYLFTGTRGTGKTSCAKILAKAVNCLNNTTGDPCLECESCVDIASGEVMDISEIDAASNNSVDDIRTLREQVNFTPAKAKYRVYIIDEVHMLTQSAFNALLKTLEEPPAHVIFVLATTEIHKLPATIISRCERFDFKRIDPEDIAERLKYVCEKENITASDAAIRLISFLADGGMRDALSILDLCSAASENITEQVVSSVCGLSGRDRMFKAADAVAKKDAAAAVGVVEEVHTSSAGVSRFLSDLSSHFRDLLIVKTLKSDRPVTATAEEMKALEAQSESFTTEELLYCLDTIRAGLSGMSGADARTVTEMTVIRLCLPNISGSLSSLEARISALEKRGAAPEVAKREVAPKPCEPDLSEEIPLPEPPEEISEEKEPLPFEETSCEDTLFEGWSELLNTIKTTCAPLAGVLDGSVAYVRDDMLLIDSKNPMFRRLLGANKLYRTKIKEAAFAICGKQFRLGPYERKVTKEQIKNDPLSAFAQKLDNLSNDIR